MSDKLRILLFSGNPDEAELLEREARESGLNVEFLRAASKADLLEAAERSRHGESRYQFLFENSPISLMEEDLSEVKKYIDALRNEGVRDFAAYFEQHPECVEECVGLIRIVDVNPPTLRLFEAESKDAFFERLSSLLTDEFSDQFTQQLIAIGEGKTSLEIQAASRTFSGKKIHGTLRWSIVPGSEKDLSRVIISFLDVTERKRVEDEIYRSRQMLQLILDNIPQRVFWKDRNFNYVGCNKPFAADAGYHHPRDLIGRSDFEMSWKESAALYREDDRQVMETDTPKLSFEELQRRADGSTPWVRTSKVPLHDRDGKVIGVLGTYEDITEQRQAEEALRASEEKYRLFFEEDLSGDYIATAEGKLLACNPTFAQIFGFTSVGEAIGSNLYSLFPNHHEQEDFLQLLRRNKKLMRREAERHRKDGKPIHVVENAFGQFNARGELTGIKGYIFDDTDRKRLEEQFRQAQKMEAVGRLAGGIAHDFNNLLTCINGYADLLMFKIKAEDPAHKFAKEIRGAGERAANLTRQLLAFSRRQVLQPEVLDLNLIVQGIEKMVRRLIGEDIDLQIVPEPELWRAKADPGQVEQVILNLAVNARDAMPGGGRLTIETANVELKDDFVIEHPGAKTGQYAMLAMSDSGVGMNEEIMSHLFEPFYTTKEPGKGTGLGLSTVYGIVKQSDGYIAADSQEGLGTTFTIYLPRIQHDGAYVRKKTGQETVARGSETILVVEDEESVRELARRFLNMRGYHVLSAADGASALEICDKQTTSISLLVTDVVMPGMGGRDLAREILNLQPSIRVLFVSGYSEEAILHEGLLEPGTDFLQKPFTADKLARKVREILDSKRG